MLYFNLFGVEYDFLRGTADFRVDFDNTLVSPRFTELQVEKRYAIMAGLDPTVSVKLNALYRRGYSRERQLTRWAERLCPLVPLRELQTSSAFLW